MGTTRWLKCETLEWNYVDTRVYKSNAKDNRLLLASMHNTHAAVNTTMACGDVHFWRAKIHVMRFVGKHCVFSVNHWLSLLSCVITFALTSSGPKSILLFWLWLRSLVFFFLFFIFILSFLFIVCECDTHIFVWERKNNHKEEYIRLIFHCFSPRVIVTIHLLIVIEAMTTDLMGIRALRFSLCMIWCVAIVGHHRTCYDASSPFVLYGKS